MDLAKRPSIGRLSDDYPRAVEWLVDLISVAKEAMKDGRLELGGESLDFEYLATVGRHRMEPGFLERLEQIGFIERDPKKPESWRISRWSDYFRYPSKTPEAQAAYKRDYREREVSEPVRNVRNSPQLPVPLPVPLPGPGPGSGPLPLPLPLPPTEDEEVPASPGGEGAESLRAPTEGNDLRSWAIQRFEGLRSTRRLASSERKRVARWIQEAGRGVSATVLRWAVDAAVAHTLHDQRSKAIESPVGYALDKIESHLDAALAQSHSNALRADLGKPGAGYVFRPPKTNGRSEGAA